MPRGNSRGVRAPAARLAAFVVAAGAVACGDAPPSYGGALVEVDTDLPAASLHLRLRIDVYDANGAWIQHDDVARDGTGAWPASFSVRAPDGANRVVLVRLRAYPEGVVRDYRGERFVPRPGPGKPGDTVGDPPPGDGPRLLVNDADLSPPTEPLPGATVDRLVLIRLVSGHLGRVRVVLRGACAGRMADVGSRATCVEDAGADLVPVGESALEADFTPSGAPSVSGTWGAPAPCGDLREESVGKDGAKLRDEEVCVPGGVFVLGGRDVDLSESKNQVDSVPERLVAVPTLRVDKYEVTVARLRDARQRGFVSFDGEPLFNEGPYATSSADDVKAQSTYTGSRHDRDDWPVNTFSWDSARKLCQFFGGDVLTEAQWEWVAGASARASKTPYAWGTEDPTCSRTDYARYEIIDGVQPPGCLEAGKPFGPVPVTSLDATDVTATGVVGMAGNMSEWTQDAAYAYTTRCWLLTAAFDPVCNDDAQPLKSFRGGNWVNGVPALRVAARQGIAHDSPAIDVGVRCARAAAD